MKYRGHESFSIRKNWLSKGMNAINKNPVIFSSKGFEAMDTLGVGRNMVSAIRYWLRATEIADYKNPNTKKTGMCLTPLGELIFENDLYLEEIGTLWLLQYKLAKNEEFATSWYFFFNRFNLSEFTKEDFVSSLSNFDRMNGNETSLSSFEGDFECLTSTYIAKYHGMDSETDPESNMVCPLSELGLISIQNESSRIFRKVIPPRQSVPSMIALAVLVDNAKEYASREIPISDIQGKSGNIGKTFNLDTITLMNILSDLENKDFIRIIRTAGLDVVRVETEMDFLSCISNYYSGLNK